MPEQSVQDNGKDLWKRKQISFKNSRRKFVNIGSLKERWMKIKSKKGCKTDEELARLLIKRSTRVFAFYLYSLVPVIITLTVKSFDFHFVQKLIVST